jgi:hypothetical protein
MSDKSFSPIVRKSKNKRSFGIGDVNPPTRGLVWTPETSCMVVSQTAKCYSETVQQPLQLGFDLVCEPLSPNKKKARNDALPIEKESFATFNSPFKDKRISSDQEDGILFDINRSHVYMT